MVIAILAFSVMLAPPKPSWTARVGAYRLMKWTNEQKELLYARNKQKLAQQRANGAYPQAERN